jgi:hypothetical protein
LVKICWYIARSSATDQQNEDMGQILDRQRTALDSATSTVADELGRPAVEGRYHRLPKRFEDDYVLDKKKPLGTGFNGAVYSAQRKSAAAAGAKNVARKVAVKAFKLHGVGAPEKKDLANEAQIFLSMDHPHIARLLDAY